MNGNKQKNDSIYIEKINLQRYNSNKNDPQSYIPSMEINVCGTRSEASFWTVTIAYLFL